MHTISNNILLYNIADLYYEAPLSLVVVVTVNGSTVLTTTVVVVVMMRNDPKSCFNFA